MENGGLADRTQVWLLLIERLGGGSKFARLRRYDVRRTTQLVTNVSAVDILKRELIT